MRVAVIGAGGRTGGQIVRSLTADPAHEVTALLRRRTDVHTWVARGLAAAVADVEGPAGRLVEVLGGHDAVVFAATGEYDGLERALSVDLRGAVAAMDASVVAGVRRFVLISGLHADDPGRWAPGFTSIYIIKHHAERILATTTLDWTVVRPGGLTQDPPTGRASTTVRDGDDTTIPRADVADFVVVTLTAWRAVGRAYDLITGTGDIASLV